LFLLVPIFNLRTTAVPSGTASFAYTEGPESAWHL
jgi:hypothetical protein